MAANFYFQLREKGEQKENSPERLYGRVVARDAYFLEIFVEGYGEHGAIDGDGSVVQLELWEGALRVLVRQDINCPDPVVLDMETAKESLRRDIPE